MGNKPWCIMDQKMTAVERAFQLARSGSVAGLAEITTSLNREGYYANQIEGRFSSDNWPISSRRRASRASLPRRPKRKREKIGFSAWS